MEKIRKEDVAKILTEIGKMLDLKGENPFKVRAYEDGARTIESLTEDLHTLIEEERLSNLEGIGEALSEKITELVRTGSLEYYENLRDEIPEGILTMMDIPGLGPKKVKAIWKELEITSLDRLVEAAENNEIQTLDGFGAKTEENILKGAKNLKRYSRRHRVNEALETGQEFLEFVKNHDRVLRSELAGSLRRHMETIGDVDILAAVNEDNRESVMEDFVNLDGVEEVIGSGDTKASIRNKDGVQLDLRLVTDEQFPFALHYFTGSKEHNVQMRSLAKTRDLKLNEYGLFEETEEEDEDGERIACETEEEIFDTLGLSYIPPELRENMGEVERAKEGKLPELLKEEDLRGLFHMHTTWSDGTEDLEEMVRECRDLGYDYVGISDHSQSARYAGGLTPEEVREQWKEIDHVQESYPNIKIFKGIESDILPDGSLDYEDELLEQFDFVVASIHQNFSLSEAEQTERLVRAVQNEQTTFLGHPTGRLLLAREPYEFDQKAVIEAAGDAGTVIEINANPQRLDLDWRYGPLALEHGVKTSINPDAHSLEGLRNVRWGVGIARKGWFTKEDVINTMTTEEVSDYLKGS